MSNPFRYFNSSPEVIRMVEMRYVRYPLSLRNVEDLLAERGTNISHGDRATSLIFGARGARRDTEQRPMERGLSDAAISATHDFGQSPLSRAYRPLPRSILKVSFGEGFRMPALCDGWAGPGAGVRKPPKEETAGS
jgi:hypothetical protein